MANLLPRCLLLPLPRSLFPPLPRSLFPPLPRSLFPPLPRSLFPPLPRSLFPPLPRSLCIAGMGIAATLQNKNAFASALAALMQQYRALEAIPSRKAPLKPNNQRERVQGLRVFRHRQAGEATGKNSFQRTWGLWEKLLRKRLYFNMWVSTLNGLPSFPKQYLMPRAKIVPQSTNSRTKITRKISNKSWEKGQGKQLPPWARRKGTFRVSFAVIPQSISKT
jgi:hypothetical protein